MKTVAVIMSVYKNDHPDYLVTAINSILKQTYKSSLFLYRDGPVSHHIQEILNNYKSNPEVEVIESDENKGLAFALNRLINIVKGNFDYIARMDSDDISRSNRIYEQVNYMEANPNIHVSGSFCEEFGASFALKEKNLPTDHQSIIDFSITRCPLIHPTVIFRSNVFIQGNKYPEKTILTEDMALWFSLLEQGYQFGNIPKPLLEYRLDENTIQRRTGIKKAVSEIKVRFHFMKKLNKTSAKNTLLISSRLLFHILPQPIIRFMYKYIR